MYPIFMKLEGRFCLVVGGGEVAHRKIRGLREAGATVTVVSPHLVDGIHSLSRSGLVRWVRREFQDSDVDGQSLVVVATDYKLLSERVYHLCERRGILCNAVDHEEFCTFHVPAVSRRGDIKVAISTAGKSPAFASELRKRIDELVTDEDAEFVDKLGGLRPRVLKKYPDDPEKRERLFKRLTAAHATVRPQVPANRGVVETGLAEKRAESTAARAGTVYLVGAGPGDSGLLTLRAYELLQAADIVFYDRLVGEGVLSKIPNQVEKVYVGKRASERHLDTGGFLVEAARKGMVVVRLKGGDPNLFGRGGDEMLHLMRNGVDFEVVPGVSALTAVTAAASIPITFRGLSHQVVVRSGYRPPDPTSEKLNPPLPSETTYVYFMAVGRLKEIVEELREKDGLSLSTSVAIVQRGTLADQNVLYGTLATILDQTARTALTPPALFVAGEVVRFADKKAILSYIGLPSAFGRRSEPGCGVHFEQVREGLEHLNSC